MGRVSVIKSRLPCDQVDRVSKEAPLKKKQWLSGRCLCLLIFLIVFVAIAIAVLVVLEPGNNSQHGLGLVAASKTLISGGWPKPRIPPQKLTNITYDNRAIILNGQRQVLITGAIHYPRSSPEMWPELFRLSKEAGINTIDTYVFWDLHEPVKGEFEFEKGNANLPLFLKLAQDAGLFVNLRIGPYICAEWNYGGLPVWLRDEPKMLIRTWNQPFMDAMEAFTRKTVEVVRPFLASHGGNIIIMQIENEYGNVEWQYGYNGHRYISWAADLANSLDTGVPWIMCQTGDALTVISACNGFYCDNWIPRHKFLKPHEPQMFTELWSGWYQYWKDPKPIRPAEDIAFSVARFIARGGTYFSYYMWHGGTNFGRSGADFQTTSYDYDAPITEYGFPAWPKYHHLSKLHHILMDYSDLILANEASYKEVGHGNEIHVFGKLDKGNKALVLLSNVQEDKDVVFTLNGISVIVPKWTVHIWGQEKGGPLNFLYSTSAVNATYLSTPKRQDPKTSDLRLKVNPSKISCILESFGIWDPSTAIEANQPSEQLTLTKDKSDYLWYSQPNVEIPLDSDSSVAISIKSVTDVWYAWIDGVPAHGNGISISTKDDLPIDVFLEIPSGLLDKTAGSRHNITLLSAVMGLRNAGSYYDKLTKGIRSPVTVNNKDITQGDWFHGVGLQGERDGYFNRGSNLNWQTAIGAKLSLIWYKIILPRAQIQSLLQKSESKSFVSFALDLSSMGKGAAWVNGHSIGRYWDVKSDASLCKPCSPSGAFFDKKCLTKCGEASQEYYHVPKDWLLSESGDVELVLFEEFGGDPSAIELVMLM